MAIYCVNFGVNFILQKFCPCKKKDKYQVCCPLAVSIIAVKFSGLFRHGPETNRPGKTKSWLLSINQGILAELMTPNLWRKGRLGRAVEVGLTTSHCANLYAWGKKTIYSSRPSCSMQKQLYKSSFHFYQSAPVYIGFAFDIVVKVVDENLEPK